MKTLFEYVAPPSSCGYLPDQLWSLEYHLASEISPAEYLELLRGGWRRFGHMVFRPRCRNCQACRSIRVVADQFHPNRSQKRCRRNNEKQIQLVIGDPEPTRPKLQLYDKYHTYQSCQKGWPQQPAKDVTSYVESFVDNPFATEEWCYYLGTQLAGVGYVDVLPGGMSAIYFYYDPDLRDRSLGTWNVLRQIEECAARRIPHLYLGYYVTDCASLNYKANFLPNQLLGKDGKWRDFRG